MKCSYCGKVISDNADVCPYCGNIILMGEAKAQGYSYADAAYSNGRGNYTSSGQPYYGNNQSSSTGQTHYGGSSYGSTGAGARPQHRDGAQSTAGTGQRFQQQYTQQARPQNAGQAQRAQSGVNYNSSRTGAAQKTTAAQQTAQRLAQKTVEVAAKEAAAQKAAKLKADEAAAKQAAKLAARRRAEMEKADIKAAKDAMMKRIAEEKTAQKVSEREAKNNAVKAKTDAKNAYKEAKRNVSATAANKAETGLYSVEKALTVFAFAFCLIGFAVQLFEMRGEIASLVESAFGLQSAVLFFIINNLSGLFFSVCAVTQLAAAVFSCVTTSQKVKSCLYITVPMFFAYTVMALLQFLKYML